MVVHREMMMKLLNYSDHYKSRRQDRNPFCEIRHLSMPLSLQFLLELERPHIPIAPAHI